MGRPITLTDITFTPEVLQSELPVLVDFWASWNSTCKALAPSIAALAEEYEGRVRVGKLDVDANPVNPGLFGVSTVPTVMLFAGGRPLWRIIGYRPIGTLRAEIDMALTPSPSGAEPAL